MSRRKLEKFATIHERENVIEVGKASFETLKGQWSEKFFENDHPLVLELACGRGEYTIGLARLFNNKNFIGIDVKGDRIWKGSGIALEDGLSHVAFLRAPVEFLDRHFDEGEVSEIWITFPDPRPKDRDAKRRVVHPRFLDVYKKIISPGAMIRLKTDNSGLFQYALDILSERDDVENLTFSWDVYHSDLREECHEIRTRYERKFSAQGHDIKYLHFRFA